MSTRVSQPAQIGILPEQATRSTALLAAFLRRFVRNRLAMIGALIIGVMIIFAVFAPLIAPYDPLNQDLDHVLEPESAQHPMGTDDLGRDMLSRIIYGARLSLLAAIYAVGIAFVIGVPVGLLSGYYRGAWDELVVMRIVDAVQAFPFLNLALALAATLGAGFGNAMIAIGLWFTPAFVRIVRAQVMSVASLDYILAAGAIGARLAHPAAACAAKFDGAAAGADHAVDGGGRAGRGRAGVHGAPTPSWGQMLSIAQGYISLAPWLAYWLGLAIFLAVMGFNLIGDGVREALDPRLL